MRIPWDCGQSVMDTQCHMVEAGAHADEAAGVARQNRNTAGHTTKGCPAMKLADEKYVVITTYTKDGTPKPAPVWPVDAGEGRLGFVTSAHTWRVKRLANNPRVEMQPSDGRGRPKESTEVISGTAEVVDGSLFLAVKASVKEKYGYQLKLINLLHALPGKRTGHPSDRAVIVTLDQN